MARPAPGRPRAVGGFWAVTRLGLILHSYQYECIHVNMNIHIVNGPGPPWAAGQFYTLINVNVNMSM